MSEAAALEVACPTLIPSRQIRLPSRMRLGARAWGCCLSTVPMNGCHRAEPRSVLAPGSYVGCESDLATEHVVTGIPHHRSPQ